MGTSRQRGPSPPPPANLRYNCEKFCEVASMGELIDLGSGLQGGYSLISGLVSILALGVFALLQGDTGNDDDDSSPGGGLMQPVGGAA
ncbi:MAG: hypothetical protein RLZZ611_1362 [Cyanobacteriota bacterium]|jgi:hypothetical protein